MKLDTAIRLGTKDDIPLILSSWTLSMKHQYPNQYALDFSQHYINYILYLINKSSILVCHLVNEPNEVISYLIYTSFKNNLVVHYAYTKLDARKEGYVNSLLSFANLNNYPVIYTHCCKNEHTMEYFAKKYIFDPSLLKDL